MKNIRKSVFETNSSSTHSICIRSKAKLYDTIIPTDEGVVELTGGEFGWQWEKYNDALTKANYCAVDSPNNKKMLIELIKEHTGAKEVIISIDFDDYSSYIDHDSAGTTSEAYDSKEKLKDFIFNPMSWLHLGNDNDSAPLDFYDEVNQSDYALKVSSIKRPVFLTYQEKSVQWGKDGKIEALLKEEGIIKEYSSEGYYATDIVGNEIKVALHDYNAGTTKNCGMYNFIIEDIRGCMVVKDMQEIK